jgi:hypothetical protein
VINFHPNICTQLTKLSKRYVSVRNHESDAFAWSVGALAHEAVHMTGNSNEAEAECYGMQTIRAAAEKLGRSSADGRYLAARYWKRLYRQADSAYGSAECRNDGHLDLHPETDVWP